MGFALMDVRNPTPPIPDDQVIHPPFAEDAGGIL